MQDRLGLNIFFEQKHTETLHQHNDKRQTLIKSMPYLERGDSSQYLEQFLAKQQSELKVSPVQQILKNKESESQQKDEDFFVSQPAKINPSSLHNFQKHLTVCLREAIEINPDQEVTKEYEKAAVKLWKIFKKSKICTKKALHYLLGQCNQHKITDNGLKQYGLVKVYSQYNDKVLKEARGYLASETLKQIKEGKLVQYIELKKLKDKDKFKKYVELFMEELEQGFLRKRLPKDKIQLLQRG